MDVFFSFCYRRTATVAAAAAAAAATPASSEKIKNQNNNNDSDDETNCARPYNAVAARDFTCSTMSKTNGAKAAYKQANK